MSQITKAIKSNINPQSINVYVGGQVQKPGKIQISKKAVLTEAIILSGGTRKTIKGPVNFLRYENDGSVDKRKFSLNYSSKRGSFRNPYLRNGDVIFVGRSKINFVSEIITEITDPFRGIVSTYGLYKIISD